MADWTTIPDTQIEPKAPVTSELMTALRDNPVAIAQGATNAPKIAESWRTVSSTSTSATLGDIEYGQGARVEVYFGGTLAAGSTTTIKAAISSDNGSTYPEEASLLSLSATIKDPTTFLLNAKFIFDRLTGQWLFYRDSNYGFTSGTFSSPTGVTNIRFRFDGGSVSVPRISALWYITGGKAAY